MAIPKRAGQSGKRIEEVVEYAVSHRTRSQLLTILDQGIYTSAELCRDHRRAPQPGRQQHPRTAQRRLDRDRRHQAPPQHPAAPLPGGSHALLLRCRSGGDAVAGAPGAGRIDPPGTGGGDDGRALGPGDVRRRARLGHLGGLDLDAEGREELFEEQKESWERLQSIKARAAERAAGSGGETKPYVVSVLGFGRGLKAPIQRATQEILTDVHRQFDRGSLN